jgi:hypothetical protein
MALELIFWFVVAAADAFVIAAIIERARHPLAPAVQH